MLVPLAAARKPWRGGAGAVKRRAMLGLGLSRYLPAALRPRVIEAVTRTRRALDDAFNAHDLRRKRKSAPRAYGGARVALIGFTEAPSGLGRGVRLMQLQLQNDGAVAALFDVAAVLDRDRRAARALADGLAAFAPSDLIVHVNPPSFRDVIRRLPRALVLECGVVGYWAWELERVPQTWRADADLCDEIWGPSQFVAAAVRASLPDFAGTIRAAPHPVDLDPFPAADSAMKQAARRRLGLAEDAFIVGCAFTMAANFARKNPLAAIDAFQRAFPDRTDNIVLALRCPDTRDYPGGNTALLARTESDPRLRLLDRAGAPIADFYHALDVFLSLHRGEGYGLQIVEALQAGAEAVATRWSLGEDIAARARFHGISSHMVAVDDPQRAYAADARWAEPDAAEAAQVLRTLWAKATDFKFASV